MPRKRILLLVLAIIAIFLMISAILFLSYHNSPKSLGENQPTNNVFPEGDLFVIPESLMGTIGLISAMAVAFGLFALLKKRRK